MNGRKVATMGGSVHEPHKNLFSCIYTNSIKKLPKVPILRYV